MAQFDVYKNNNDAVSEVVPYFLDIQADLLRSLATRLVVPLYAPEAVDRRLMEGLALNVRVRGKSYVALVPEIAGVPASELGAKVTNLADVRYDVVSALDMLITGV